RHRSPGVAEARRTDRRGIGSDRLRRDPQHRAELDPRVPLAQRAPHRALVPDGHERDPVPRRYGRPCGGPRRHRRDLLQHRVAPDRPAIPHVPVGGAPRGVSRVPAVQFPPGGRHDLPRRQRGQLHRLHPRRPRGDGRLGRRQPGRVAVDPDADPGRAVVRHRVRGHRARRHGQGALAPRVARVHGDGPRWRIAAALAVGVFISCTPFYGFQTLVSLVVATVFRLSKATVLVGTWLNLPWFAPLVYGAALWVGGRLVPDAPGVASVVGALLAASGSFSWPRVVAVRQNLSVPLLVGTTVLG